ncbi:MAG: hypothetical protein ACK5ME_10780 [Parahaliea sp.]
MKKSIAMLSLAWAVVGGYSGLVAANEGGELSIDEVPPGIVTAAQSTVSGAYYSSASWVLIDDMRVYRLKGSYFNREITAHIREDGKIVRVEKNNRDD